MNADYSEKAGYMSAMLIMPRMMGICQDSGMLIMLRIIWFKDITMDVKNSENADKKPHIIF